MHRLRFLPALTDPLLLFKRTHSSALVVWGYLGRAIPCLMSSEAKISVLASEWLASLWALLPERNQWEVLLVFFLFWWQRFHLEAQRSSKEKGHENKYIQRDSRGGEMNTVSLLSCANQFSPLLVEVISGFIDSPLQNLLWILPEKVDAHFPSMKQSRCQHTVNLFCPCHSWQLAHRLDSHSAERHRLGVWLWRGWASRCHRTNELIY